MSDAENNMACHSYGFGRWKAPYWFIGPEQGKGPNESADNKDRLDAWLNLGGKELCDCRRFHELIHDDTRHREKPHLQPTWRPLITLLMAFLGKSTDREDLRTYQRDLWGMESKGETCLIELSAFAARSLKTPVVRTKFRQARIECIRKKLHHYKPAFVVMYGLNDRESWEQISGCKLNPGDIVRIESTLAVLTPHPVAFGRGKQYWIELGQRLRQNIPDR